MNQDSPRETGNALGDGTRTPNSLTAASAVLYTDLDHTLHRSDAYRTKHGIIPGSPDTPFFEFANVLEQLLAPFKEVVIVLSTSWVQELGFEETRSRFPTASLRARIVDSTYHPGDELAPVWGYITRGAQVLRHVRHHRLTRWLAVDDDRQGFDGYESHLIHCQRSVGLGDKDVQELFARRLELMFGTPDSLSSDVSPKPECPR